MARRMQGNKRTEHSVCARHSPIAHHNWHVLSNSKCNILYIIISFNLFNKLMKLIPLVSQFFRKGNSVNNCLKSRKSEVVSPDLNPGLSISKIAAET